LIKASMTGFGKSCLGIRLNIELATWVGAANSVAGARARTRERVFVKIIVDVGIVDQCGVVRLMLCDVRQMM
jgi:hypothetical protein